MKGIKKAFICEVKGVPNKKRTLRFIMTNATEDRTGEVVDPSGGDFKNFLMNPVIPFGHDYKRLPVGRGVGIDFDGANWGVDVEFVPKEIDEFADKVYRMADAGFIKGASIGFIPKQKALEHVDANGVVIADLSKHKGASRQRTRHTKWELLEVSIVPIPANPTALQNAVAAGIINEAESKTLEEMAKELIELVKKESPDEYTVPAETLMALHRPLTIEDFISAVKTLTPEQLAPSALAHSHDGQDSPLIEVKAGLLDLAADAAGEPTSEQKKVGTAFPIPKDGKCPDKSVKRGSYCVWVKDDGKTALNAEETVAHLDKIKKEADAPLKEVAAPVAKDYMLPASVGDASRAARRSERMVTALEQLVTVATQALGADGMGNEANRDMLAASLIYFADRVDWALCDYACMVEGLHEGEKAMHGGKAAQAAHDGYLVASTMLRHKMSNVKTMKDVTDAHDMIGKAARAAHGKIATAHAAAPAPKPYKEAPEIFKVELDTIKLQAMLDAAVKEIKGSTGEQADGAGGVKPTPDSKAYDAGELLKMGEEIKRTLRANAPARA